jgi:hypothetical protein
VEGNPRVPIASAQDRPSLSRPLRTGSTFVLVAPSQRVVVRRWDKVDYQPGEECRLTILGQGLGKDPLSVTVETEDERGGWAPVVKLRAEVAADGKQATASWRFPKAAVVPGAASVREADGSVLSNARFEDTRDLEEKGTVWMTARAEGFEGRTVQVVLEREDAQGKWVEIGRATSTVRSGTVRAPITPAK